MIRGKKLFNKIILTGFVMTIAVLMSSPLLQAHFYCNNFPRSYIEEVDSARRYVFSIVNERKDAILRALKSIKSHTYNIPHQEIILQNNQELSIDHGILMNAIINGLNANVSRVIIGTRCILINTTFIGVSEIIIQGDYNMIIGIRLNKTHGVFVKGSNNLLYDVIMSHTAMGIKIINTCNNTIWKFNISYVGYLPVGESPKIIAIINGNNNLIAHGIGVAPYSNWGIYIERGANNIVFNVTIASAHNYFKFNEVKSLFLVNCQAIRKHGLYGDDYFEGSVARNGKVFIMNPIMIESGTDALILSGSDGIIYVVNPYFFRCQSLISFSLYHENLTVIFINATLSLVETKTWYRSYIPNGVKLVMINTTFTLLEFIYCKGIIETYPLPLFVSLLKDTIKVFWKVLASLLAIIIIPPAVVNFIIHRVVNNEET
jgi:hypothetical protein